MNIRIGKRYSCAQALALTALALTTPLAAQTRTELDIQTCAGLTLTGTTGMVYSIEFAKDTAETNSRAAWHCLEYLLLPASPYPWTDRSAPASGNRFYRATVVIPPTNMVFIPPGSFRMGSPTNELDQHYWDGPQTTVTISRGFWIGKYEVTQGEYLALMGTNPSYFQPPNATEDTNRPVERVSWDDAGAYCAALTQRERAAGRIATNSLYRLPTEAEWEYACRGWTASRFSYGEDPSYTNLTQYAWYFGNGSNTTHAVGLKLPNPWDLYDMHGNVWEWCQDWWSEYLPGGIQVDPRGPASGAYRVIRGGGWRPVFGEPIYCRSASRYRVEKDSWGGSGLGFRVVLAPGDP